MRSLVGLAPTVTVASLPVRGRPPKAAARRAGLEVVEKLLTSFTVEPVRLTVAAYTSRFCMIATVVRRAIARAVCRAFVAAMRLYGIPDEVLTDNGKQFTGRFGKPRPAEVLFEPGCAVLMPARQVPRPPGRPPVRWPHPSVWRWTGWSTASAGSPC